MNNTSPKPTATSGDMKRLQALEALDMPKYVLMPGDPERIDLMASQWTDAKVIELPRGYRAASGTFDGQRIGAISTSIGAPSLELVFTDMARLGVHTFLRVGTCGTLREDIITNSLIVNDSAVRLDGTTNFYARAEYPATASHEVTMALCEAVQSMGEPLHVGTGCTSGSFLAGQGRPGLNDFLPAEGVRIFAEMKQLGVLNFEMETSSLLTLARIFGFRAGAVVSVIANRITGVWGDDGGIEKACLAGAGALARLSRWDATAAAAGRKVLTLSDMKN